jgi:hypothetical protein
MPTKNEQEVARQKRRWWEFVFNFEYDTPAKDGYMFRREIWPDDYQKMKYNNQCEDAYEKRNSDGSE